MLSRAQRTVWLSCSTAAKLGDMPDVIINGGPDTAAGGLTVVNRGERAVGAPISVLRVFAALASAAPEDPEQLRLDVAATSKEILFPE